MGSPRGRGFRRRAAAAAESATPAACRRPSAPGRGASQTVAAAPAGGSSGRSAAHEYGRWAAANAAAAPVEWPADGQAAASSGQTADTHTVRSHRGWESHGRQWSVEQGSPRRHASSALSAAAMSRRDRRGGENGRRAAAHRQRPTKRAGRPTRQGGALLTAPTSGGHRSAQGPPRARRAAGARPNRPCHRSVVDEPVSGRRAARLEPASRRPPTVRRAVDGGCGSARARQRRGAARGATLAETGRHRAPRRSEC